MPRTKRHASRAGWHAAPTGTCMSRPPLACWINKVERWFAEVARKQLQRRVHRSTDEPEVDISALIDAYTKTPSRVEGVNHLTGTSHPPGASARGHGETHALSSWIRGTRLVAALAFANVRPQPTRKADASQAPMTGDGSTQPYRRLLTFLAH